MSGVCLLDFYFFAVDGTYLSGGKCYLPSYLDWLPIQSKAFWFVRRGLGDPAAKYALLNSQGEQTLAVLEEPLQNVKLKKLQEIDNELEDLVEEHARINRLRRTPRNQ